MVDKKDANTSRERFGMSFGKRVIISTLIACMAAAGFNKLVRYVSAPISYESDGKTPIYTQMISDPNNNLWETYRKAKFGADVNATGGMDSIEEMDSYPSSSDYESVIEEGLAKRVAETPSRAVIERGLRNATKYTDDGTHVTSFNGSGMDYWMRVNAFDRDGIKRFAIYEINPDTKEKVREIQKFEGDLTSHNHKWGKFMTDTTIYFDKKGIGDAKLLRLEVTDKKNNRYHSFIELNEKKTFFDYIVEDMESMRRD